MEKLMEGLISPNSAPEVVEWTEWDLPSQWAGELKISTTTFIRHCKAGRIVHEKIGSKLYRIKKSYLSKS
jgi:hypothetical protein